MKSKANPKQNKNGKTQSPKKPKPKSNSTQTKKKNSQINKKGKASTSQTKGSANPIKKKPNAKTAQSKKRGRIQCELHCHDTSHCTTYAQPSLHTVSTETSIFQMRSELEVNDNESLLLAVAWTTAGGRREFNLFPEVLFADVDHGTNREKRPLLQVCGKDAHGESFIVLQCFMPLEKQWIFLWCFMTAMVKLFGPELLRRV